MNMLEAWGMTLDWTVLALILFGGAVTLFNRLAGHYILRRFEPINFRLEAALEAVPVAVITTIVVPAAVQGGPTEWIVFATAMLAILRFGFMQSCLIAMAVLLLLRQFGF